MTDNSRLFKSGLSVVDIAIIHPYRGKDGSLLLGQKKIDGDLFRFPGGFVDPDKDNSLEEAAKREAFEETGGIETGAMVYLGSLKVNNSRYVDDRCKLFTAFFRTNYIFGAPQAQDDLDKLQWFDLVDLNFGFETGEIGTIIIPEHRPLMEILLKSFWQ